MTEEKQTNMDKLMELSTTSPLIRKYFVKVNSGKLDYGTALELIAISQAKQIQDMVNTYRGR